MLRVVTVKDQYITFLRDSKGFDKVYDHKITCRKHKRIYVGIVFTLNDINYFAPFSSPKRNDYNENGTVKNSTFSILRMTKDNSDDKDNKVLLGTIRINNMIPVPDSEIVDFNLSTEDDEKYKNLIADEIKWVRINEHQILNNCKWLYLLKINEKDRRTNNNSKLLDATLDFKKLEDAYFEWLETNHNY